MMRHSLFLLPILFLFLIFGCQEDSGILSTGDEAAPQVESSAGFGHNDKRPHSEVAYQITLDNLCPVTGEKSSQPFSPPVFATHTRGFHMYQLGHFASYELSRIAEVGNGQPMAGMLSKQNRVYDIAQGSGVILPGTSATFNIKGKPGFHQLSFAAMLGITNDGFTGVDGINLPKHGTVTYYLHSYDAGSERNTELERDLAAFGNPDARVPTHRRIRRHRGILGIGDLDPAIYGWKDPVARLTITVMEDE